ncbi:MAG: hypothetical protein A2Y82_00520 [Candidatus Buchananbacteria bacterium RBG_13_36_9]|uniref:Uncharacterized protein n=1 Tax=Candidatus Buchananbacteria bacterium RBG_13_36_9 TaxID=1797530 RepID=A0A1G1XRL8_9BACT|nr:MAG: hypothetical protein A2Y82_00520 [Candidatus Buchananbacteria bacterium RBG_13_36_9]
MARVENNNQPEQKEEFDKMEGEIEQLKKELKRKQSKKFFNCGTCSIIFIIIFLILAGFILFLLAKSGLAKIPVFSDYFFQEPQPSYTVKSIKYTENDFIASLKDKAVREAAKQKKYENFSFDFELTDEESTALLRSQIAKQQNLKESIEFIQLAGRSQNMELFIKFKNNIYLILEIDPKIKNEKVDIGVKNFKIGKLSLPPIIAKFVIANIGESTLNSILGAFKGSIKIQEIRLGENKVVFQININNLNQFKNAF